METENTHTTETADALVIVHIFRKDPDNIRYRIASHARDDERNLVSMDHIFRSWIALGNWMLHHTDKEGDFFHLSPEQREFIERMFHESTG